MFCSQSNNSAFDRINISNTHKNKKLETFGDDIAVQRNYLQSVRHCTAVNFLTCAQIERRPKDLRSA